MQINRVVNTFTTKCCFADAHLSEMAPQTTLPNQLLISEVFISETCCHVLASLLGGCRVYDEGCWRTGSVSYVEDDGDGEMQ